MFPCLCRGADSNDYAIRRAEAIIDSGLAAFGLEGAELAEIGSVANGTPAGNAVAEHLASDRKLQQIHKRSLQIFRPDYHSILLLPPNGVDLPA